MYLRSYDGRPGFLRHWFPAALVVLLVVAVPGVVLYVLHLLGKDAAVNTWLQDRLNLSYHLFLTPWAALLLLLVPLLILLLYFLKLKRKPLQVPSTFLWRKSIEDLHVNSLFQWLRENVLLLLQLLTVVTLLYAVLAFQLHGLTGEGRNYILMIDNSASMAATDVSPSRLEAAKQAALDQIDAYRDSDFGMVIVFNSGAEIVQDYTNDRGVLRKVVSSIRQTQRPTRLDEALHLADTVANPNRPEDADANRKPAAAAEAARAEVHLYSDGGFPDVTADFAKGNLSFHYHAVGKEPGPAGLDNLGISAARAESEPVDDKLAIKVFVNVVSFRQGVQETRVRLEVTIDGEAKPAKEELIEVGPRQKDGSPGQGSHTFLLPGIQPGAEVVLHATLPDARDALPVDDEAWLVPGVRRARVLIVSPRRGYRLLVGTPPLLRQEDAFPEAASKRLEPLVGRVFKDEAGFLRAVADAVGADTARQFRDVLLRRGARRNDVLQAFCEQPRVARLAKVDYIDPEELKDKDKYGDPAGAGEYDLVIFDRVGPQKQEDLPRANTWFIDCLPPPWDKASLPEMKNPPVQMNRHPLLSGVETAQRITIFQGFRFNLDHKDVPPGARALIELTASAATVDLKERPSFLFTLDRGAYTDLVMTFSFLDEQDRWATDWAVKDDFTTFLNNLLYELGHAGGGKRDPLVRPGQPVTIYPDGAVEQVTVGHPEQAPEVLERGNRAEFVFGKTDHLGVYNVSWAGQTRQRFAVNLLDEQESNIARREKFRIGTEEVVAGEVRDLPRDLWKWIALGALLLLLLEWYVYNRRVYV